MGRGLRRKHLGVSNKCLSNDSFAYDTLLRTSETKMGMVTSLPSENLYYTNYLIMVEWGMVDGYQMEEHVIYGIIEQLHDWNISGSFNKREGI